MAFVIHGVVFFEQTVFDTSWELVEVRRTAPSSFVAWKSLHSPRSRTESDAYHVLAHSELLKDYYVGQQREVRMLDLPCVFGMFAESVERKQEDPDLHS